MEHISARGKNSP